MDKELMHYGIKRKSGRYPWGSGKEAYRRSPDFRATVLKMRKQGMSEKEIAKAFNFVDHKGEGDIKRLRNEITIAKSSEDVAKIAQANRLFEKGYGYTKIAEIMGLPNESSARSLLDPNRQERSLRLESTTNMLLEQLKTKKFLDVGAGIEFQLGVKRPLLDAALTELENQGFKVHTFAQTQLGTGKETRMKVLTEADYGELMRNKDKVRMIEDWSDDGGQSFKKLEPVKSLDSSRMMVRFKEDGGADMDGAIQLRRGVEDLSLGDKHHAQVRIEVDGTHFMKGMAIYADDMPHGVDVIYNSSKSKEVGKFGALKKNESDDPTNPFATTIRQEKYIDSEGKEQLSPLNRVGYSQKVAAGEEGYWASWNKDLSSQFLAKQNVDVAKEQLGISLEIQRDRLSDIQKITNPAVKQRLLDSFADDSDSKAVHLAGAALPRQSTKVILPVTSLKENEVYAPGYDNGEQLLLVRYPHAGTFEIPKVTVNNKNSEGVRVITPGNIDAIGIHPKAAQKLSGADFDGDHVLAIPYDTTRPEHRRLKYSESLPGLKDFDPKSYKLPPEVTSSPNFKKISDRDKNLEMGKVSNLITDMTVMRAPPDDIQRAVRHSQVVIDSQKHDLDYKQSAIDNGIAELKTKYQGAATKGASTILSRAATKIDVDATRPLRKGDAGYEDVVRRGEYSVDKVTGQKVFAKMDPKVFVNKDGETVTVHKKKTSSRMYETEDATTLMSKNPAPIERVYAEYANEMKKLGNVARLESISLEPTKYSPSAAKVYDSEVRRLDAALALAERNAPKERQAHVVAEAKIKAIKEANPDLTVEQIRKITSQQLESARQLVGAGKERIQISQREWEAIQAGAVRPSKLDSILSNTKIEDVQKLATPKADRTIAPAKVARAKRMLASGYTLDEIAESLGISTSSVASIKIQ